MISSKTKDIILAPCDSHVLKFDRKSPVDSWLSCNDAYDYTWATDKDQDIVALSHDNREKLIRSMGFCPHQRCQLDSVGNAPPTGKCPNGLCYTKVENGSKSFGACCFVDGKFQSGDIVGYYQKLQQTPKPIYHHSRVILGRKSLGENDFSKENFINANKIHPNIIATQCPLHDYSGFLDTFDDVKRMMLEQDITLWIQLAPDIVDTSQVLNRDYWESRNKSCKPFGVYLSDDPKYVSSNTGVSDYRVLNADRVHQGLDSVMEFSYSLTGYFADRGDGDRIFSLTPPSIYCQNATITGPECKDGKESEDMWTTKTQHVKHFWYLNWVDFETPRAQDDTDMRGLIHTASAHLRSGENMAISCLSGRGRTGTLATMVVADLENVNSTNDIVDVIVNMRQHRDGIVETPPQFRYLMRILNLPDPGHCSGICQAKNAIQSHMQTMNSDFAKGYISGMLTTLAIVVIAIIFFKKKRSQAFSTKANNVEYSPISDLSDNRNNHTKPNPNTKEHQHKSRYVELTTSEQ